MSLVRPTPRLSVIIPTLDEGACIDALLIDISPLRDAGHEIIVVDGGSGDDTVARARPHIDRLIHAEPGRAVQLNAGAGAALGDVLWFVHADTRVPHEAISALQAALADGKRWGRFDVRLSGTDWRLRIIERLMNLRSCLTGIATGDQGIFVERMLFETVGRFPSIPLMEDIALSRQLRGHALPACIRKPRLQTSSRRWETRGVGRTVLLMWRLRLMYACGATPEDLARLYR